LLGRIQEGAEKMQSLLADVVDFWATGASGREPVRTDMEAVLERALLTLEKQIAERGANVTHDPLPSVMGDFGILVKVLQHLIRNAVEYCVTSSPQVHISASREHGDWVFAVRDNGPGIDPMFQERIFGTFKRLHGREYPGNGLGLAFSRKAVEVDGGRMWVESTTGAGSTFYFTLPPAD
jgi:chemotaxis family two-component system sensor kinase Cph1